MDGRTLLREKGVGVGERGFALALTAVLLFCVLTVHKGRVNGDGVPRFEALRSLVEEGRLTGDRYSLALPLAASPLYVAAKPAAWVGGLDGQEAEALAVLFVGRFNGMVAVAMALGFFLYLRRLLRWSRAHAVAGTAFLFFGSMLLPHARDFYSECLWTLGSALGLWLLVSMAHDERGESRNRPHWSRWRALALVSLLALLVPLNPVLGLVFPAAAAIWLASSRTRRNASIGLRRQLLAWTLAGIALGAALCALENQLRRGAISDFGYTGGGFSTPVLEGLLRQFVAPGYGILFFIPAVFAGIWWVTDRRSDPEPRNRSFIDLSLLYSAMLVLAYATWHGHGGWYWGPRFLLPLSVFGALYLVVLMHQRWHSAATATRILWAAMTALSVAVYKVGVAINHEPLLACLRVDPEGEPCFWKFEYTPLASWLDPSQLGRLFIHRSSAAELATLLLLVALVRWWPDPGRNAARPQPLSSDD